MTYIGVVLDLIREKTGNISFTEDTDGTILEGISDNLILSFANEALRYLQSRIIAVYSGAFVEQNIQSVVADQEAYSISDNLFLNNKIVSVEFSPDGDIENYYLLAPVGLLQRRTCPGNPYQYIRRDGQLLINPIPTTAQGSLRVNYYRAHDRLNIRRGQITSKTSTTIVLDNDSWLDDVALGSATYICIVDSTGAVQDYNVLVSSYDSGTRTITIPSQTLTGGAGNYVVTERYATTHLQSNMPERALDYIRTYSQERIYSTDSSMDEINEKIIVKDILADIVDGFSELSEDVMDIPILDGDLS